VWCRSSVPIQEAGLSYNGLQAKFYPVEQGRWRALMGISSMETPGPKAATFFAQFSRNRVFQSTVPFIVQAGTYPVSHVALSRERDSLITSGQMERDARTLNEMYRDPGLHEKMWSGTFILPTTGVVSSVFGARRSYADRKSLNAHTGLDIANQAGTLIVAPNRGKVVFSGWLDSFGNTVLLDHGLGVYSYYLHMRQASVEKGAVLEQGAPLGLMGAEGVATGPHLHWSFVVSGERVNPVEWTEREFP
jgi:murein DD-endopeptidase MepM/ murein hydrolase activator NlpD